MAKLINKSNRRPNHTAVAAFKRKKRKAEFTTKDGKSYVNYQTALELPDGSKIVITLPINASTGSVRTVPDSRNEGQKVFFADIAHYSSDLNSSY